MIQQVKRCHFEEFLLFPLFAALKKKKDDSSNVLTHEETTAFPELVAVANITRITVEQ